MLELFCCTRTNSLWCLCSAGAVAEAADRYIASSAFVRNYLRVVHRLTRRRSCVKTLTMCRALYRWRLRYRYHIGLRWTSPGLDRISHLCEESVRMNLVVRLTSVAVFIALIGEWLDVHCCPSSENVRIAELLRNRRSFFLSLMSW